MISTQRINVGDIFLQSGSKEYYVVLAILQTPRPSTFVCQGVRQFMVINSELEVFQYYLTDQQFFVAFGKNQIKAM